MNQPHKHRDVIIAWANGEEVEYRANAEKEWETNRFPSWCENSEYRIKPKEPKRLTNENFMELFREYAYKNLSNKKDNVWYISEMDIALDISGSFFAWLEKQ